MTIFSSPKVSARRRMRIWQSVVSWTLLMSMNPAIGQDGKKACDVERSKKEWAVKPPDNIINALAPQFNSASCSSIAAVFRLIGAAPRVGGRKLEPDKAVNSREGEAQRAEAAADPAFASALAAEMAGETEASRKLLLEAAVLHDKGYFKARDLLLVQLRSGVIQ